MKRQGMDKFGVRSAECGVRSAILSSVVSGLLLALALNGPATAWLAWLALVPLLFVLLESDLSLHATAFSGWLFGMIAYGIHFSYVPEVLNMAVFLGALAYLSLYPAAFATGVAVCRRRNPEWGYLVAPFLWTALEFVRSHGLFAIPSGTLGMSQAPYLPILQIAAITGMFGVSFLIITVNAALSRLIRMRWHPQRRPVLVWSVAATLMLLLSLGYGYGALSDPETGAETLRVAAVEGGIDERKLDRDNAPRQIRERYRTLTVSLRHFRPQLTVYPETMTGTYLKNDSLFLEFIRDMGDMTGSAFLVGSRDHEISETSGRLSNSAFLIEADGRILDRYDKRRLVPFGEFTPLAYRFPWLTRFRVTGRELTPGTRETPLRLRDGAEVGVGICYEAAFGADMRRLVTSGARMLAVVSDDIWFYGTPQSQAWFYGSVFRAVENRIPVVHCANVGVSGILDSRGRRIGTPMPGHDGVLYGTVHLRDETSVYTRFGDVLAWGCGFVSLIMLGGCFFALHTRCRCCR